MYDYLCRLRLQLSTGNSREMTKKPRVCELRNTKRPFATDFHFLFPPFKPKINHELDPN